MSRKLVAVLAASLGLLIAGQQASANDKLFKSYAYDAPIGSFSEATGYYDCADIIGGQALCLDDVAFVGHKFTAALIFSNGKLSMVSLLSPYSQEVYARVMGALAQSFALTALSDGKTQLDLVDLAATSSSKEQFATAFSNYENVALRSGNVTYSFLEGIKDFKGYKSSVSLMEAAPDNMRSAELVMAGQGVDSALIIRFAFPKLEARKVLNAVKQPVESF